MVKRVRLITVYIILAIYILYVYIVVL